MQNRRPSDGDHTQHPLSETHSDTGFQLTQVTLGRKVREQKGAWVRALERFNIVVIKSAAQLLGTNRFVGSIMETP